MSTSGQWETEHEHRGCRQRLAVGPTRWGTLSRRALSLQLSACRVINNSAALRMAASQTGTLYEISVQPGLCTGGTVENELCWIVSEANIRPWTTRRWTTTTPAPGEIADRLSVPPVSCPKGAIAPDQIAPVVALAASRRRRPEKRLTQQAGGTTALLALMSFETPSKWPSFKSTVALRFPHVKAVSDQASRRRRLCRPWQQAQAWKWVGPGSGCT